MVVSHGKKQTLYQLFKKRLANTNQNLDWRFYGRRSGRALTKARKTLLDDLLPRLSVTEKQISKKNDLDPTSLFDFAPQKIILEIGFGNGEHLAEMMRRHPENGYIGAEPFINGMSSFLKDIQDSKTTQNIRVLMDNVIPLVQSIASESIDEIYVLNPDPWHKKRHHQRRIINQKNLDLFSKILKPEGRLIMSTDVRDLIEWMVTQTSLHPDFKWLVQKADDWREPPSDWIPTRYESKGAKGADKMNYLFFKRINLSGN